MSPAGREARRLTVARRAAQPKCMRLVPGRLGVWDRLSLLLRPHSAQVRDSSFIFLPQFPFQNPNTPCYWPGLDAESLSRNTEPFPAGFDKLSSRPQAPRFSAQASGSCTLSPVPILPHSRHSPPRPQPYLPRNCPLPPKHLRRSADHFSVHWRRKREVEQKSLKNTVIPPKFHREERGFSGTPTSHQMGVLGGLTTWG